MIVSSQKGRLASIGNYLKATNLLPGGIALSGDFDVAQLGLDSTNVGHVQCLCPSIGKPNRIGLGVPVSRIHVFNFGGRVGVGL